MGQRERNALVRIPRDRLHMQFLSTRNTFLYRCIEHTIWCKTRRRQRQSNALCDRVKTSMHRELTFKKSDPIQLVANQSRGSYRHAISRNFIPHESKMRDFGLWKETGAPGQKKKKTCKRRAARPEPAFESATTKT